MIPMDPIASLPTHEVTNAPELLADQDLWNSDLALKEGVIREGAGWADDVLAEVGRRLGRDEVIALADQANCFSPEAKPFDRHGRRINQVSYHPAYHKLMDLAISNQVSSFAWNHEDKPGSHVGQAALGYMFHQMEGGVMCPMAMTYSVVPVLRTTPEVGEQWIPRLASRKYDPRDIPVEQKTGATMGMCMTEKQGGSDVRANTTRARPEGAATGIGAAYLLTGHKYFCSAPMSDAFLITAYSEGGLSCFLVPRWRPGGTRNGLYLQRLKDKLGNKSNASAEIELLDTFGIMVGQEGRGIRTIIEMVQGNRFYCGYTSAGLMRQSLVQAIHHADHRSVFERKLIDQPLMKNVLADLAIESEAAIALSLRLGRAITEAPHDPQAASLARIGTAIGKYWICKRTPNFTYEALECLGGSGYVEESVMPRIYREAPLNNIWDGSGNVMCLDVLRAMFKDDAAVPALLSEVDRARGGNHLLDRAIDRLKQELNNDADLELRARKLTEDMALIWQAALLVQYAPSATADAFCFSRLGDSYRGAYGTLPSACDFDSIVSRARGL